MVVLSIPGDEDECPLTLEPIKDSRLACMPDAVFMQEKPQHSKVTLPCGHGFHALSLLYNWCKNNMLCPCCRDGVSERADPACLPESIRDKVHEKVRETLQAEEQQDEAFLEEEMQAFEMFGVSIPYTTLAEMGALSVTMNFYQTVQQGTSGQAPMIAFSSRLNVSPRDSRTDSADAIPSFRPQSDLRTIARMLGTNSNIRAVQLIVQLNMQQLGVVPLDSTQVFELSAPDDGRDMQVVALPGASGRNMHTLNEIPIQITHGEEATTFHIWVRRMEERGRVRASICNMVWAPRAQFMELISTDSRVEVGFRDGDREEGLQF
jgi:hypothetical protein